MKQVNLLVLVLFIAMGTQSVFAQNKKLLKAAQNGNTEAIANLASCYYRGLDGFEKNEEQANYWANKALEAANAGALDCQFWILGRYLHGDYFVEKDLYKAKRWAMKLFTNREMSNEERSIALKVNEDIDKEINKQLEQEAQYEEEELRRKINEIMKDPLKMSELVVQIIENKDLPVSRAEILVSHIVKMDNSAEKNQALKKIIKECQKMGTEQELILSAKIQEYLIERGNIFEGAQNEVWLEKIIIELITEKEFADKMPEFPGGPEVLYQYLSWKRQYPQEAEELGIQGTVVLDFDIEKDGSITNAKVVKSVHPLLDKEALRVVSAMPHWIPGKRDGKRVRMKYRLGVRF